MFYFILLSLLWGFILILIFYNEINNVLVCCVQPRCYCDFCSNDLNKKILYIHLIIGIVISTAAAIHVIYEIFDFTLNNSA